jgi:hypothetical protein
MAERLDEMAAEAIRAAGRRLSDEEMYALGTHQVIEAAALALRSRP